MKDSYSISEWFYISMVYHFITKELDKVFEGKFECVGENAANLLLLQYKLKKSLIMVKQLHIN